MRSLLVIFLMALTSCGTVSGNRDKNVPMQSIVAFDLNRLQGRWDVVAAFPQGACIPQDMTFAPNEQNRLAVTARCSEALLQGTASLSGPGRFDLVLNGQKDEYWVLWVDEGYRSAVLGTPSGNVGWILNRTAPMPIDRLNAAREILDWNGYDLSRLQWVSR